MAMIIAASKKISLPSAMTVQHHQGDGVDEHGVERQDAVGHIGGSDDLPEVHQQGKREAGERRR